MKELTCILCPKGCRIQVEVTNNDYTIKGNGCKRGVTYAKQECEDPRRSIQTTVETIFNEFPRLSVKTDRPVAKVKIREIMDVCHHVLVEYEVETGAIIVDNICDSGADLVATTDLVLRLDETKGA